MQTSTDERHRRIARDSLLLTASYGATALVGVAFWTLAARTVPPRTARRRDRDHLRVHRRRDDRRRRSRERLPRAAPGRRTGAQRRAAAGLRDHPDRRTGVRRRRRRLHAPAAAHPSGLRCGRRAGSPLAAVIWSMFVVQDPILTAYGKAHWLLAENLPVNLAKLALLPDPERDRRGRRQAGRAGDADPVRGRGRRRDGRARPAAHSRGQRGGRTGRRARSSTARCSAPSSSGTARRPRSTSASRCCSRSSSPRARTRCRAPCSRCACRSATRSTCSPPGSASR